MTIKDTEMTIDINKRMMEKHSETVKQTEAERAMVRARKEVEINGNGTSGYTIKEGEHKGITLAHIRRDPAKI
jgi:hypothetical protein